MVVWKWKAMTATSVAVMMIARDRTIFTSLNDCNMTLPFGWARNGESDGGGDDTYYTPNISGRDY